MPSTQENLKEAFAGESQANRKYLAFAQQAEKDGFANVARLSRTAAEAVHAKLYQQALEAVKEGKDLEVAEFYLCPIRGHIEFGQPPESCPICGAKAEKFIRMYGAACAQRTAFSRASMG